jgi:hypothetical protein
MKLLKNLFPSLIAVIIFIAILNSGCQGTKPISEKSDSTRYITINPLEYYPSSVYCKYQRFSTKSKKKVLDTICILCPTDTLSSKPPCAIDPKIKETFIQKYDPERKKFEYTEVYLTLITSFCDSCETGYQKYLESDHE